ncbi:MAG: site-2 protease family protein [Patescibacteria group bacterium]
MTAVIILIGFYLVILLYSVIIHEVSHGVAALFLGDRTAQYADRLNLNPAKHVDPFGSIVLPLILFISQSPFLFGWAKPVPYNPYNLRNQKWGPTLVALAGPASNLLLASLAALIAKLLPLSYLAKVDIISRLYGVIGGEGSLFDRYSLLSEALSGSLLSIFFGLLLIVILWNVVLACFNLLPIPPLDGSKLLYALLPLKEQTKAFLEQYGLFILIFVILFLSGPIGIFIGSVLKGFFTFTL